MVSAGPVPIDRGKSKESASLPSLSACKLIKSTGQVPEAWKAELGPDWAQVWHTWRHREREDGGQIGAWIRDRETGMAEEDAASMDAEIDALLARHREYLHEGEPESEQLRDRMAVVLVMCAPDGRAETYCSRFADRHNFSKEALSEWNRLVRGLLRVREDRPPQGGG